MLDTGVEIWIPSIAVSQRVTTCDTLSSFQIEG